MRLVSNMVKDQRLSADSLANKSEHWYRWITFQHFFMGGRCMTQHMTERQKKGKEKSEDCPCITRFWKLYIISLIRTKFVNSTVVGMNVIHCVCDAQHTLNHIK